MAEARSRRENHADEVAKRSAEKDKRRFMATSRRSGEGLDLGEPAESGGGTGLRLDEEFAGEEDGEGGGFFETVGGGKSGSRTPKSATAKSNTAKSKKSSTSKSVGGGGGKNPSSSSTEWDLVTALTTASEIPHPGPVNASTSSLSDLQLLAMLESATADLSREDKKKRRKRLANVRKKLHGTALEVATDCGSEDAPLTKLAAAITKVRGGEGITLCYSGGLLCVIGGCSAIGCRVVSHSCALTQVGLTLPLSPSFPSALSSLRSQHSHRRPLSRRPGTGLGRRRRHRPNVERDREAPP